MRRDTGGGQAVAPRPFRVGLSKDEAAEALGISRDHFDRHVLPHIRTAAIGRRVVVPVAELEAFLRARAV